MQWTGKEGERGRVEVTYGHGVISNLAEVAPEGQVDDRAGGATVGAGVGDGPVDAGEDAGVAPPAVGGEDFDADEAGPLSDAVGSSTNGTCHVGAVAVAVLGAFAADEVGACGGSACVRMVVSDWCLGRLRGETHAGDLPENC